LIDLDEERDRPDTNPHLPLLFPGTYLLFLVAKALGQDQRVLCFAPEDRDRHPGSRLGQRPRQLGANSSGMATDQTLPANWH